MFYKLSNWTVINLNHVIYIEPFWDSATIFFNILEWNEKWWVKRIPVWKDEYEHILNKITTHML